MTRSPDPHDPHGPVDPADPVDPVDPADQLDLRDPHDPPVFASPARAALCADPGRAISVIVPSYNPSRAELRALHDSLVAQTHPDFEVLVVDDASQQMPGDMLTDPRFRVVRSPVNLGPGAARNLGVAHARHDLLFFTDSDCVLEPGTLAAVLELAGCEAVIAGDTRTHATTLLGACVALLGLPGGGSLGFDKVWKVDEHGYARYFSTCNVAMHRKVFEAVGGFDPSLPVPAGEDTLFSQRAQGLGYRIRYSPDQVVRHAERGDIRTFAAWHVSRGRGLYHLLKRLRFGRRLAGNLAYALSNSLRRAGIFRLPLVAGLMLIAAVSNLKGFLHERRRCRRALA